MEQTPKYVRDLFNRYLNEATGGTIFIRPLEVRGTVQRKAVGPGRRRHDVASFHRSLHRVRSPSVDSAPDCEIPSSGIGNPNSGTGCPLEDER